MKRYNPIVLSLLALSFFACENEEVQLPTMRYMADQVLVSDTLTCSKGETLTFTPTGDADYVSFWSGEPLKNYFRVQKATVTNAKISFVSGLIKDALVTSTTYEFKVLLSTDYTANHLLAASAISSIKGATWTDITSSFADNTTLSATAGVPSGNLDVTAYSNKPFYIAFKYKNDSLKGPTAYVKSFAVTDSTKEFGLVTNLIAPVTTLVTGLGSTSWYSSLVSGSATANKWVTSGGMTQIFTKTNEPNEAWLVSPIINLSRGTADQGLAIKDITGLPRPYTYIYNTVGVYSAVFVYTNSYLGASKATIQKFIIKVK